MDENSVGQYKKTTSSMHGISYQMNILIYTMLKCNKLYKDFQMATELESANKCDDAVIITPIEKSDKKNVYCIQAKHKQLEYMNLNRDTLVNSSMKADYSILKYFKSFLITRENFKGDKYQLTCYMCTNVDFDEKSFENDKIIFKTVEVEPLLQWNIKNNKKNPHYYKLEFPENHPYLEIMKNVMIQGCDIKVQDSDIKDFFDKFIWMMNQPNEVELYDIVKEEFAKEFNLSNAELITEKFMVKILHWLKSQKGFYWTKETFKRDINSALQRKHVFEIIGGLSFEYIKTLKEMNLVFHKIPSEIDDFVCNKNQPQIVHLISQYVEIGAMKVSQALQIPESEYKTEDSCIFLQYKNFLRNADTILEIFEGQSSIKLMVLTFDSSENVDGVSSIIRILLSQSDKKIFLISKNSDTFDNVIDNDIPMKCIQDDCNFQFLNKESKMTLMKKKILFQGKDVTLGEILCVDDPMDLTHEDMNCLESILVNLYDNDKIEIGNPLKGLAEVADCYIDRKFENYELDRNIFRNEEGIFAITGNDANNIINKYYPSLRDYTHYTKDDNLDRVKIIMLDPSAAIAKKEYAKIIENGNNMRHSIHLVKVDPCRVLLLDSYRNDVLKKRLKTLKETELFHEKKNRIITINDSAGMGKSTVLTHICQRHKDENPSTWVVRLDLNDYSQILNDHLKKTISDEEVIDFFIEKLLESHNSTRFKNKITKILFKHALLERGKVILVLDGFDEISPSYEDLVIKLITGLAKTKVEKLITSTRPHTKESLLTHLDSALFSLIPFTQLEQETCLQRIWKKKFPCDNEKEQRLNTYSKGVIKVMAESISSNNFTAVPLQIMMLSEVFKEKDPKEGWQSCSEFIESDNEVPKLPRKFNITALFDKFVDMKLTIYEKDKKLSTSSATIVDNKLAREHFYDAHKLLAVHVLFPEKLCTDLMNEQEVRELERYFKNGKEGVIEGILDDTPKFVHRTFAEYFGAFYLQDTMKHGSDSEDVCNFMINNFLVIEDYRIIRAFLNNNLRGYILEKYKDSIDINSLSPSYIM